MKTLLIVRHAKSDWENPVPDFERPLAERGIRNAHKMAEFLIKENIQIDQMITSSALRAKSTCAIFAKIYKMDFTETIELYHANENQFIKVISAADDEADSLAIYSHNNSISEFANSLCGDDLIFKTCAVAIFQINTESWTNFKTSTKELKDYFTPRNLD